MAHLPHLDATTRLAVERAVEALRARYGAELKAVIAYGSATGPDFLPGRSDVNLLVVVSAVSLEVLDTARETASAWRRGRIRPILMSADDVPRSLDVFPIEATDIRERGVVLYGADLYRDVQVQPEDVRRQCEFELKRHLMMFRQGYLAGGPRDLGRLVTESITALLPLLRAFSRLRSDAADPASRADTVSRAAHDAGCDPQPLLDALTLKTERRHRSASALRALAEAYLQQLQHLAEAADRLRVGRPER